MSNMHDCGTSMIVPDVRTCHGHIQSYPVDDLSLFVVGCSAARLGQANLEMKYSKWGPGCKDRKSFTLDALVATVGLDTPS